MSRFERRRSKIKKIFSLFLSQSKGRKNSSTQGALSECVKSNFMHS